MPDYQNPFSISGNSVLKYFDIKNQLSEQNRKALIEEQERQQRAALFPLQKREAEIGIQRQEAAVPLQEAQTRGAQLDVQKQEADLQAQAEKLGNIKKLKTDAVVYADAFENNPKFKKSQRYNQYKAGRALIESDPMTAMETMKEAYTGHLTDEAENKKLGLASDIKERELQAKEDALKVKQQQTPPEEKINTANEALVRINAMRKGDMSSAVGAKGASQLFGLRSEPVAGSGAAGFVAQYNGLKSLLTLENLGKLKGVLSDTDMKVLSNAASALSLDMPEKDFTSELDRVENIMKKVSVGLPKYDSLKTGTSSRTEAETLWGE